MFESNYRELVQILIRSVAIYTQHGMSSKRNKGAYLAGIKACLDLCSYGNHLDDWHRRVKHSKSSSGHIPRRVFSDPRGSYELAHEHALNIIDSIKLRFETGGSSPDSIFLRNIKEST